MGKRKQREILDELACIRYAIFSILDNLGVAESETPRQGNGIGVPETATDENCADMGVNRFNFGDVPDSLKRYGELPGSDVGISPIDAMRQAEARKAMQGHWGERFHEELPGGPSIAGAAHGPSLFEQIAADLRAGTFVGVPSEQPSDGFQSIGDVAKRVAERALSDAARRADDPLGQRPQDEHTGWRFNAGVEAAASMVEHDPRVPHSMQALSNRLRTLKVATDG